MLLAIILSVLATLLHVGLCFPVVMLVVWLAPEKKHRFTVIGVTCGLYGALAGTVLTRVVLPWIVSVVE